MLPLRFLDPSNQWRFKFTVKSRGGGPAVSTDLPSSPTFKVSTEVWIIEYRETEPRTMIRTTAERGLPSHGRFWINPDTGQVLASELIAEDLNLRGVVTVGYDLEPALQVMVPVEMHEQYEVYGDRSRVLGVASYNRFRQFQVKVDEKIAPVK